MPVVMVILSEDEARKWMQDVTDLNGETQQALEAVSKTMTSIADTSSGDLVDQMCRAGDTLFNGISSVVDASAGLVDSVGGLLNSAGSFVETVTDSIVKLGGLFGLGK